MSATAAFQQQDDSQAQTAENIGRTSQRLTNDQIEELEQLASLKQAAAERFSAAVKTIAEKQRLEKTVVSAFIMARVNDKVAEYERKCEQMDLLLDGHQ